MKTDREELARVQSVLDAYHAHPGADAEPPARLDALILSQARAAVQKPVKRVPRWPMAMAASFAVASFSGMLFWKMRGTPDVDSSQAVVLQAPATEQVAAAQPVESDKDDFRQQAKEAPPAAAAPPAEMAGTSPTIAADVTDASELFPKPDSRVAERTVAPQSIPPPPMPEPIELSEPELRASEETTLAHATPDLESKAAAVAKMAGPAPEAPPVLAEQAELGRIYQESSNSQAADSAARAEEIDEKSEHGGLVSEPAYETEIAVSAAPAPATTAEPSEQANAASITSEAPQDRGRADDFVPDPARSAREGQLAGGKLRDRALAPLTADTLSKEIAALRKLLRNGKVPEARARWLRFTQRYPDAELPEDLRNALN